MNIFSYKMDHDFGLAPNPFWNIMTLAVCKSQIRMNRNLHIGDWIIGTGSMKLNLINHLIYAMKVEEFLTFDEYWNDPRFDCKKPIINGTLVQMYGDNIYHTDLETGNIIQEPSAHTHPDRSKRLKHLKRDTGGRRIPLSKTFYYFGDKAPFIPSEFRNICCTSRDYQYQKATDEVKNGFVDWLTSNYHTGIYGDPIDWNRFNLQSFDYYEDL